MKLYLLRFPIAFLFVGIAHGGEIKDVCSTVSRDPEAAFLKVYYKHWLTSTVVSLTPTRLLKSHTFYFESGDDAPNPSNASSFMLHADGAVLRKARPEEIDCRWAFVVSDYAGHEKLCIYSDASLSRAIVNGSMFVPDGRFRKWTKTVFGKIFQLEDSLK